MFSEFRERFRYLIDRAFAREFLGPLLLFGVLVVGATLIGMSAVFFGLFSAENSHVAGIPRGVDAGFWDSMWWSLKHVIRLRAFEEMYGATPAVLAYAGFLSLAGLGVFGVLVSLINNAMRSRIEMLRQGDTPVKERGHVVVLGWNNRVFAVLKQLAQLQPGASVVILSTREMDKMSDALRVAGIPRLKLSVILRSGIPSNTDELGRIAVERASAVVILSGSADDGEAVKTLSLLASREEWPAAPPTMTAEIAQEKNYELAQIGARDRLHIVSSSRVISKMIVQTIRNPGLARVYDELMAIDGNSIYVQATPACTDSTMGEIGYGFSGAVPIGVTWETGDGENVRHAAALNLEPDYDIAEDERLVFISTGLPARYTPPVEPYQSDRYRDASASASASPRVLLIGWTDILYDILRELNAHAAAGTQITVLSDRSEKKAQKSLERVLANELDNLEIQFQRGNPTERSGYIGLDLASFQSVVVLADAGGEERDADATTLRVLLRLTDLTSAEPIAANVVVELLDDSNRGLFAELGVRDIVASAEVISAQLAQISQQKVLGSIYRELLSAGGIEISLRNATDYVTDTQPCRFDDMAYAAKQRLETALGVIVGDNVLLNPDRAERWTFGADDRVIVLAQQVYR